MRQLLAALPQREVLAQGGHETVLGHAARPQLAHEAAHLGQRVRAGLLDLVQQLGQPGRVAVAGHARRLRREGDAEHGLRGGVVQLAREPVALLGRGHFLGLRRVRAQPRVGILQLRDQGLAPGAGLLRPATRPAVQAQEEDAHQVAGKIRQAFRGSESEGKRGGHHDAEDDEPRDVEARAQVLCRHQRERQQQHGVVVLQGRGEDQHGDERRLEEKPGLDQRGVAGGDRGNAQAQHEESREQAHRQEGNAVLGHHGNPEPDQHRQPGA